MGGYTGIGARNVTIAGDRGRNGSRGSLLYTTRTGRGRDYIFHCEDNVRFTGIRARGPTYDHWENDEYPGLIEYSMDYDGRRELDCQFATLRSDDVEVENCEVHGFALQAFGVGMAGNYVEPEILRSRQHDAEDCSFAGFTFAGVRTGELGGTQWTPTVRDCRFEDNNARGLGYGVVVYSGYLVIKWCYFDNNRHDIAGGGSNEVCGYEARYNHVGERYGMEMHDPGGQSVHIHHNTFERKVSTWTGEDRSLVVNRGTPAEACPIHDNWFKNPDRETVVTLLGNAPDYYEFSDNHFGPGEPPDGVGQPGEPD